MTWEPVDQTEGTFAEDGRREQETQLRLITDTLPALVAYVDADQRYRFNNQKYEEWHGRSPSELFGKHVSEVLGEAAYATIRPYIERALAGEFVTYEAEARLRHAGSRYFSATYAPDVDAHGTVRGFAVLIHDLTERKRSEEALRESEARLRLAQQAGGIGMWDWDIGTNTMGYSPDFLRLLGLPPDAPPPTRQDWHTRIIHPDDEARVDQEVWAAVAGARPFDTEFRVTWPNGEVHWLAVRAQLVHDAAGAPVRMIGVTFDVTERHRAEAQLRRMDRMESVGRLAGGVAHEVNNQMAVVLACADFILRHPRIPAEVRQDAEFILQAAERSAGITAQLLAFSRRQLTHPEVLDLNAVVEGFAPVLRRALPEGTTLLLRGDAHPRWVRADKGQLEQVLLNLILNAADAMPNGGTVTIATAITELDQTYGLGKPGIAVQPGCYVRLSVSDSGHGMDRETLSRAFEPFVTTKGVGKGTGLGLSSVYGIVKQAGGYVWLYSELGLGTAVKVYLPLVGEAPAPEPAPEPSLARAAGTILVADDEATVRDTIARALRREGYSVLEAADGQEALSLIESSAGPLDLVLTDMAMPVMGGRALIQRLKTLRPEVAVLAMSGYTDDEIARRDLMADEAPFIGKPFTVAELAARVRALVGSLRGEDPRAE
jgi:two-component system, cell cycle sensor histidine kinase and response regulator CckA